MINIEKRLVVNVPLIIVVERSSSSTAFSALYINFSFLNVYNFYNRSYCLPMRVTSDVLASLRHRQATTMVKLGAHKGEINKSVSFDSRVYS